jgi:hypothetical protein
MFRLRRELDGTHVGQVLVLRPAPHAREAVPASPDHWRCQHALHAGSALSPGRTTAARWWQQGEAVAFDHLGGALEFFGTLELLARKLAE